MKLISHPKYPAHGDLALSSDIKITEDRCYITYEVSGDVDEVVMTETSNNPMFCDELWKMTCFEMFVQQGDGPQYYEYNFAPNGDWASYHFDDYRTGMKPINIPQPKIDLKRSENLIRLDVSLEINVLPVGELKIGLYAMIFSIDDRSFWALDHSENTPNFHQRDCFLHPLTAR